MKTPISILDRLLEGAARLVKKPGTFCRELHSNVVSRFSDDSYAPGITEQLDAVYKSAPESSRIDPVMTRLQIESLSEENW